LVGNAQLEIIIIKIIKFNEARTRAFPDEEAIKKRITGAIAAYLRFTPIRTCCHGRILLPNRDRVVHDYRGLRGLSWVAGFPAHLCQFGWWCVYKHILLSSHHVRVSLPSPISSLSQNGLVLDLYTTLVDP
jgi:hypothetical protein